MSGSLQGIGAGRSVDRPQESPTVARRGDRRSTPFSSSAPPDVNETSPQTTSLSSAGRPLDRALHLYVHSRATMADEGAPRSIAQLADEAAATIHFSNRFSCRAWLRSCDALTDQALQAHQRGEVERAFICWARAAT